MLMKCTISEILLMPVGTIFTDMSQRIEFEIIGGVEKLIAYKDSHRIMELSHKNLTSTYLIDSHVLYEGNSYTVNSNSNVLDFYRQMTLAPVGNTYNPTDLMDYDTIHLELLPATSTDFRITDKIQEFIYNYKYYNSLDANTLILGTEEMQSVIRVFNHKHIGEHTTPFPIKIYGLNIILLPLKNYIQVTYVGEDMDIVKNLINIMTEQKRNR